MTKNDLKVGMIIEEGDGNKYSIGTNGVVINLELGTRYCDVDCYNYDLTYGDGLDEDENIVKVYDKDMNLLWDKRKEMFEDFENFISFTEEYLGVKLHHWQKEMLKVIYKNIK